MLPDHPEQLPDEKLVDLVLENQDNFLYLMKRYETRLLRYILRLSNVRYEEAEDILQEVFIKVYHNLNSFDKKLKFSSWIYRITHNQVISNFRKIKARPQSIDLENSEEIVQKIASDLDLDNQTELIYLREKINPVLQKIDPKYRDILILRFWEDKSYQEISDILKKPAGTVAAMINRAKKQIKQEFMKQNIKF